MEKKVRKPDGNVKPSDRTLLNCGNHWRSALVTFLAKLGPVETRRIQIHLESLFCADFLTSLSIGLHLIGEDLKRSPQPEGV